MGKQTVFWASVEPPGARDDGRFGLPPPRLPVSQNPSFMIPEKESLRKRIGAPPRRYRHAAFCLQARLAELGKAAAGMAEDTVVDSGGNAVAPRWSGSGLTIVVLAAVAAYWLVSYGLALTFVSLEHPELHGFLEVWRFARMARLHGEIAFTGALWVFLVTLGRTLAALAVIYWLRHLLPVSALSDLGFRRPTSSDIAMGICMGIAVEAASIAIVGTESVFVRPPPYGWHVLIAHFHGLGAYLLSVAQGSVLAPLGEETLFRGVLLTGLMQRIGAGWAVLASALAFGLFHVDVYDLPFLTAAGIILALTYLWRRTLWASITAHATANFISFTWAVLYFG